MFRRRDLPAIATRLHLHRSAPVAVESCGFARRGRKDDDDDESTEEYLRQAALEREKKQIAEAREQDAPQSRFGRILVGIPVLGALLGKTKYLMVGAQLFKFKSLASMMLSVGVYGMFFGLPYAAGMVGMLAVHEAGPATAWAMAAKVGDSLTIGGPRGSAVVAPVFDWWLFIADETGLPAMGRWVEELPAGQSVITLGAVPGVEDQQVWNSAATQQSHWVHRPVEQAAEIAPLLDAAKGITLPEGRGFIWIAAEAKVARALRDHFEERGHPRQQMKAAGYWIDGHADASDKALD